MRFGANDPATAATRRDVCNCDGRAWSGLFALSLFPPRGGSVQEIANAQPIEIGRSRKGDVAMLLASALEQVGRIGHLRAADNSKLHTCLAEDDGANQTRVSGTIAVANDPARPIEFLKCTG